MLMDLNIFILNGYGLYVWPAFIFSIAICYILYLKTNKEFRKQEKMFLNEFKQIKPVKIKAIKGKESLPSSLIF